MKGLGWKPDVPDFRDYVFSTKGVIKHIDLPAVVDWRYAMPPVYDQGELGSCTAQSVCGLCEFLRVRQEPSYAFTTPSRLFLYYMTREAEGTVPVDSGASLRSTIKTVNKSGVCEETYWPYEIQRFAERPEAPAYVNAELHQALEYQRVPQNLAEMKTLLAAGYPFVFGFVVYESFYSLNAEKNFIMQYPGANDSQMGGHAILAVGYDDESGVFIIRNSWGPSWGDAGYFYMPYDIALSSQFTMDFWTIKLVETGV